MKYLREQQNCKATHCNSEAPKKGDRSRLPGPELCLRRELQLNELLLTPELGPVIKSQLLITTPSAAQLSHWQLSPIVLREEIQSLRYSAVRDTT